MASNEFIFPNSFGGSHPYAFSINHWLHFEGYQVSANLYHAGQEEVPADGKKVDIKLLAPQNLQEANAQKYDNLDMTKFAAAEGGVFSFLGELARDVAGDFGKAAEAMAGQVRNPREQQHFTAPQFRTFNYSWDLTPTNSSEINELSTIMNEFKKWSYPSIVAGAGGDDVENYVTTYIPPLVWRVSHVGSPNAGGSDDVDTPPQLDVLNSYGKLGLCVINAVNINYSSAGVHSQFAGGQAAMVNFSLNMTELKLQHRGHFDPSFNPVQDN